MFYRSEDSHGLPYNPFYAIVAPRPIGWISTRDNEGNDNLAPYSFFNAVASAPPQVMFSSTGSKADRRFGKDSVSNIKETGVFCANLVDYSMREKMNLTSGSYNAAMDEFSIAAIDRAECDLIPCSRVACAPANLECRLFRIIPLGGSNNLLVLGEVVGSHIRDDCIRDGRVDLPKVQPVARLGYADYCCVGNYILD